MSQEDLVYQRIGEFIVSFQWLENQLREIGWFILDPTRSDWPPRDLRNLTNHDLVNRVHQLFIEALPQCKLTPELEDELTHLFASSVVVLHELRRDRNRILHSAFIELKAAGEVQGLLRSDPKALVDEETGDVLFNQELLTPGSFSKEIERIGRVAVFLNRAYLQLIHRYPNGGG